MINRKEFLPDRLTLEIQQHARDCYPEECIGVISKGKYIRLKNKAGRPEEDAKPDMEIFGNMLARGLVDALIHSHPDGPFYPTYADMLSQINLDIPHGLVACYKGAACTPVALWGDSLEPLPLKQRPFQHGISDCYEACRDWYSINMDLHLMPVARSWEWWNNDKNLYVDHIKKAGFFEIEADKMQYGDAILFKVPVRNKDNRLVADVYNHAAIYQENDTIYHHTTYEGGFKADHNACLTSLSDRLRGSTMFLRPDIENRVFS